MQLAAAIRHKDGPKTHPLWRMHPERWLESVVFGNVEALDGRLRTECVYSQVPAFSAADRAMIDVLALTRESRLAVVELKADEDLHLPLQGVDYWSRVAWHQDRGEFRKFRIFPRPGTLAAKTAAVAGRARAARASGDRYDLALPGAGDRVGTAGH